MYHPNFTTLWGDNVFTMLDINVWSDDYRSDQDNGQFGTSVANWLGGLQGPVIPEPTTFVIWSVLGGLAVTVGRWRQ